MYDFKIWTLSSAPSLLAPSLHVSMPSLLASRSWARRRLDRQLGAVDPWRRAWRSRSWRRRSWRRAWRQYLWRRGGVLTRPPTFLPEPSSSYFCSLSGFFSPHFALSHESAYWTLETLIWSVDLREQGIIALLLVFFASIRYILVGFFNLRIVIT